MSRIAIWAANTGLFVLCCYLAASIINEVAAEALIPTASPQAVARQEPAAAGRSWQDRQAIVERDLFASSQTATAEAQPAPGALEEEYEETQLPLQLLGTAASSQASLSWAAVEDQKNREHRVVRVGDLLLEEAQVVAIERRRIVLERDGRREQLALDEEGNGASPSVRRVSSRGRDLSALRQRIQRAQARRSPTRVNPAAADVDIAGRNPAEIFSSARILPKYDQGQMVGIELNNVKPGSLFEEVGIQDGDVITQFNGIEIDSPQGSAQVLRELTQAGSFEVNVVGADGQERTLTYEVPR